MAVNGAVTKNFLTFVAGLITEASPLSFPENAAKDLDNLDLRRDGSIYRRLGLTQDFVDFSQLSFNREDFQNWYISTYVWKSVDGDGSRSFAVVQVGPNLIFHNFVDDTDISSAMGYIDFTDAGIRSDFASYPVRMTQGRGKLYVVNKLMEPFAVQFNADGISFTGLPLTLKIRDIDGLDEREDTTPVQTGGSITPPEPSDVPRVEFDLPFTSLVEDE